MNIIANDYVYVGMVKTGSTYIRRTLRLIDKLEGNFHERFNPETVHELPTKVRHLPCFGTIRNPWTWYPANWKWFSEDRFSGDTRSYLLPGMPPSRYTGNMSFEEWVRKDPAVLLSEFYYYYTPNVPLIRMENMVEDLTRVLEDIRGPLSEQAKNIIKEAPIQNKNPSPPPGWTDELQGLVIKGARPIFEKYYPEELDKWGIT